MSRVPSLTLSPRIDPKALAQAYARDGRVSITPFLSDEAAAWLADLLRDRSDWQQVLNSQDKTLELSRAARAQLAAEQQAALDAAVYGAARYGFQYRYETIRVPDAPADRAASNDPLCAFAQFMASDTVLTLMRDITGAADIRFADAQATAYSPGDFLTGHDDAVAGKDRRAAYVLGLTRQWRAEWGGLLMFHDSDRTLQGWSPAFNSLSLFRVPQIHSVSEVTRAAAFRRYSITGWLRASRP